MFPTSAFQDNLFYVSETEHFANIVLETIIEKIINRNN